MSMIKLIQATPELSGKDAVKVLRQVNVAPTKNAVILSIKEADDVS